MNTTLRRSNLIAAALVGVMALTSAHAQQVPIPQTAADVPGPVPGNTMTKEYVQFVGSMAYIWGYPMVNAHNRRAAFAEAPAPGLLGGVVPRLTAPLNFCVTGQWMSIDSLLQSHPRPPLILGSGSLSAMETVVNGSPEYR
jgi:hypothetical protein